MSVLSVWETKNPVSLLAIAARLHAHEKFSKDLAIFIKFDLPDLHQIWPLSCTPAVWRHTHEIFSEDLPIFIYFTLQWHSWGSDHTCMRNLAIIWPLSCIWPSLILTPQSHYWGQATRTREFWRRSDHWCWRRRTISPHNLVWLLYCLCVNKYFLNSRQLSVLTFIFKVIRSM